MSAKKKEDSLLCSKHRQSYGCINFLDSPGVIIHCSIDLSSERVLITLDSSGFHPYIKTISRIKWTNLSRTVDISHSGRYSLHPSPGERLEDHGWLLSADANGGKVLQTEKITSGFVVAYDEPDLIEHMYSTLSCTSVLRGHLRPWHSGIRDWWLWIPSLRLL